MFDMYFAGGRSVIDGVAKDDLQQNLRAGLTFALPVDARKSLNLSTSRGVSARTARASIRH